VDDFPTLRARHIDSVRSFTPEAVARLSWSRERVHHEQVRGLRRVLAHAQRHSSFHAARLGHVDAETFQLEDLVALPSMTKDDVMDAWDQVVTDRELHLEDVTAHLDKLLSGEKTDAYLPGKYYAAATGGFSGKRGIFLWDWETFVVTANIAYRMEARHDLREPPTGPRRTAVICAGSYVHASRFLFPTMLDPEREAQVFPAGRSIPELVAGLNEYQPDRLVGYASIIQALCAEALDGRLRIRPRRISTNSEPLLDEARAAALEAWGINIHNSWGSVEIGLAASEGESFDGMILAEDFLIFEAVDVDNRPVADLARAEKVLVTKLYGTVMPLIRYELTDSLILAEPNPEVPGCRRIREIKGRSDAWFVYPGNIRIHPMSFRGILGQDRHVSEYQVQQTLSGARVLAIVHGSFSAGPLEKALVEALAEAGLQGAIVTVQPVAELPRHPETNKLKRFVALS
jgi:phenylacetate-coenzyme A ligase PaaK-like adenylate-forming protein